MHLKTSSIILNIPSERSSEIVKQNDEDNARFLVIFDKTGWTDKARFIKACLFKHEI